MLFWREDSRTANRAMILNSDNPNNETLDGYSDFHLEEIRYLLENGVEIPRFNSELAADQFWVENELHIVDALAAIDLFGENEERLLYLRRELLHRIGHFRRDASFPWWNFRLVFRQPQLFFSNLREWYGEQKAGELFFLKYRDVYSSTLFDLIPYAESELECAEFMRLRGDFFTTLGYLWQHRTSVWKSGFAWRLVWKCAMGNRLPFVV
jgi:hypothetical protein